MAKIPTVVAYSPTSGAIGTIRDYTAVTDRGASAASNVGDTGFAGIVAASQNAAAWLVGYHYTADTGW